MAWKKIIDSLREGAVWINRSGKVDWKKETITLTLKPVYHKGKSFFSLFYTSSKDPSMARTFITAGFKTKPEALYNAKLFMKAHK